jgi:serine phosphatase RsbU (regulator of sigma subunit)
MLQNGGPFVPLNGINRASQRGIKTTKMKPIIATALHDLTFPSKTGGVPLCTSHILLVEDDPILAGMLEMAFHDADTADFVIERETTIEAAIPLLGSREIDVILLDLNLPDSRGLETFWKIQRVAPNLPIIILSGLADEALAVESVRAGAQDYFVKGSMSVTVLMRAVRYALERKQLQRQVADYAWQLRTQNEAMKAELELARDIQLAYLPLGDVDFPRHAAANSSLLHVHSRLQPATQLGGDFFDVLEVSDTNVGIFICDVMGHGAGAGLVAGILRGLIEEARPWAGDPGMFLSELNCGMRAVLCHTRWPIFATAFYLIADLAKEELRYANAGHPCPLFRDQLTGEVGSLAWRPGEQRPALGLFDNVSYATTSRTLQPSDLFILYTDGLCEATSPDGMIFGIDRLFSNVREQGNRPTPELFDFLLEDAKSFSARETFEDDVCILGIQMLPCADETRHELCGDLRQSHRNESDNEEEPKMGQSLWRPGEVRAYYRPGE